MLPIADLVHADEREPVKRRATTAPLHDSLDRAPNRAPRDPEHVLDRGLVAPLREVRDLVVEVVGEPRAHIRRPRHAFDHDPAARARDSSNVIAQEQHDPSEIEMAPPALLRRQRPRRPPSPAARAPLAVAARWDERGLPAHRHRLRTRERRCPSRRSAFGVDSLRARPPLLG